MSAEVFRKIFDGKQTPAKDQDDYQRKQAEEPLPDQPAPKRGRVTSPLGPLERMSREEIEHQVRGVP